VTGAVTFAAAREKESGRSSQAQRHKGIFDRFHIWSVF
jgi:hypothetical protein